MKSSLNSAKKSTNLTSGKTLVFFLGFIVLFSFLLTPLKTVKAQAVVTDPGATAATVVQTAKDTAKDVKDNLFKTIGKLLLKAGATSFQQVVRTALNKIAYDTATYLGSGNKGQKPLFITEGWDSYLNNIGDAALGQFIETFVNNLGTEISTDCQKKYQSCAKTCEDTNSAAFDTVGDTGEQADALAALTTCDSECKKQANKCGATGVGVATSTKTSSAGAAASLNSLNICQPSSLEAKVKISLGLVAYKDPGVANCTASKMIENWGDEAKKLADFKDPNFLEKVKGMFDPTSNDLGIYMSARNNIADVEAGAKTLSLNKLVANKGWLDNMNIAGDPKGTPEDPKTKKEAAQTLLINNIGKTTTDIVVDAASVFVNQIALTSFNRLMASLAEKAEKSTLPDLTDLESNNTIVYGEGSFKEAISSLLKPDFSVRADYDILTTLSVCPDKSNPGPTDCVIDGDFMQAVTERKTVIEAINDGNINKDWQLTKDTIEGTYSLRNISILRKYRILPVGWEEAINRASTMSTTTVTVMDMVSCFSDTDDYKDFSKNFNIKDSGWCLGLVDPNWVLKAPLNSCSKEGFGSQVISEMVSPSISVSGSYTASAYNIGRGENYCADEKTCIKEKTDGSCEAYGYCNEEKRTWNFSADGCDPVYNTCQSFTNENSSKSVSYLKNTLSYAGCNPDSAGCQKYSVFGSYATSTKNVSWDAGKTISLNKEASDCSSKDEGCTELLRTVPTWGSNLIMDADFNNEEVGKTVSGNFFLNDWYYWSPDNTTRAASIVESSQEPGTANGKALKLDVTRSGLSGILYGGVYSSPQSSLLPDNFQLTSGQAYTVSVDVYLTEGSAVTLYIGKTPADGFVQSVTGTGSWQHLSVTRLASSSYTEPTFGVVAENSGDKIIVYIQHLKFEVSNYEKDFKGFNIYGSTYKVYEKLIPPYLESVCYNNVSGATKDYTLKSNPPEVCSNFARRCNREEAGCEKFTGVKNGLSVSAQVTASDYCWGECVGYDTYISKEDYFNSPSAENIIPTTAKACSAKAVGCNEFTNLDELSAGGETKEYYSSLKRCIKPSQGTCGTFYSWEGTGTGYQLRSYSLEQDASGLPKMIGSDSSTACNQEIYSLPLGDANYNADCREFYNAAGKISYHLVSKTITCSEDCHAYRMNSSLSGVVSTQSCLNDGVWDAKLSACIYQAIPGEGSTCTAEENGCREYNGNNGNNVRQISSYNFENGLQGWTSNTTNGLQQTTISNNNNGHSAFYKSDTIASTSVGTLVSEGKSYVLRFIAKADNNTRPKIYFSDKAIDPKIASFTTDSLVVKGGGGWNIYSVNLSNLDHAVTLNEILAMTADNNFYFDDVVLTEITDRYYLVKGSSVVPDRCYYDTIKTAQGDKVGNYQGPDYSLGCSGYTDRNNLTHNLRKFSKLCSSSAVGCEQVIATQNYSPYGSGLWNDTNSNGVCDSGETDCIKVERDKAIYAVFDSKYQCNSADLGCSRLGQAGAGGSSWTDVYKNNTPNSYDVALCSQAEVGCEAWTTSEGTTKTTTYFRDPGNETCQYRNSHDASISGKAWYMIPVKRCDSNGSGAIEAATEGKGAACSLDSDCSLGTCMVDNNDYACSTSYFKTFGLGGSGNGIQTPDKQAGLCQATASGCTEYIDPVSTFAINLVNNPSYATSSTGIADGWSSSKKQIIALSPNKLYILSVKGGSTVTGLAFTFGAKELLVDNTLSTTTQNMTISAGTTTQIMFASLNNTGVEISGGEKGKVIELKEAIINYQLQKDLDEKTCAGVVDFNNGCVLFNERSIKGASGLTSMANQYDAVNSPDKKGPISCNVSGGTCSANKLLKVSPNRVCSKWLDCLTYVTDPETKARTCYAVGECTRLNDNYECANFEDVAAGTVSWANSYQSYQNTTGYSLLDKYHLSNMKEVGLNTDAHFDFEDSAPALSCIRAVGGGECASSKDIITDLLVREPEGAPTDYPAHGASYLKVPASYIISPQSSKNTISVRVNQTYFVNFLVNTKNSGTGAKVKITSDLGAPLAEKSFTSNNGWSRQILSFKTNGITEVKIYLSAATSTGDRAVYFDDINIEPVLEVAKVGITPQYVARECRLYPTNDSLTCVNKNNNVLKDGWEGYCLEHDADNPGVCSLWYPVDKISAEGSLQKSSGYQGIFPLNYCTEVNGNFDLVEKVVGAKVQATAKTENDLGNFCDISDGCDGNGDPHYITMKAYGQPNGGKSYTKKICIPKESSLLLKTKQVAVNDFNMVNCSDDFPAYFDENNNLVYWEGWAKYDGKFNKVTSDCSGVNSYCAANPDEDLCLTKLLAATSVCSDLDEASNADPSVRVYDYDHVPADEEGLKLISGIDADKIYRLTCNNFIQAVDSNGENMAWAARVGINSAYPTSTPLYFVEKNASNTSVFYGNTSPSNHLLFSYGRNRETTPFGAATWPDSFNLSNSEPVKLKNQFSAKNSEDVLAGRPYGCSNYKPTNTGEQGTGCSYIGACSLNQNVYCLAVIRLNSEFQISVDDTYAAYFNEKLLFSRSSIVLDSSNVKLLANEKNVLAIKATDLGGAYGIAAAIDGIMTTNKTDGWKCTSNALSGDSWKQASFNDSSWSDAVVSPTTCTNCNSNKSGYQQIWAKNTLGNSTIYCRYVFTNNNLDAYVSKKTCAEGGYGTCVPLWSNYLGTNADNSNGRPDFQMILRNLFLKSYNSYSFKDGSYASGGLDMGDSNITPCTGNKRSTSTDITAISSSFCSVTPSIGNISLTFKNQVTSTVSEKGIYGLRFTTALDSEQEPLKEIYIEWGDNTRQTITGQDSHPSVDNPHIFYHYYKTIGPRTINITVKDNWNITSTKTLNVN